VIRAVAAALIFAALPASAFAQAYQCRIPQSAPSVPKVTPDGPVRQMAVRGYTLALSWSPEYCRGREHAAGDAWQCSGQGGRFGFIVHGLWPEGGTGKWPQWCPVSRAPTPQELARNLCITPSAALLAREWAKHGSCMVGRPEAYFRVTRILWNSLRWPDFDRLSRDRDLTAGQVRRAFADANPYWKPEHVGIKLNARGWMEEMRLCYGKDFMPAPCDSQRYGPRDSAAVKIWRGL
jgi:ribonuclease T2